MQYNLVPAKGMISLAGKVTVGLVESNDSLPPGLWLWLTAKRLVSALGPTFVLEYWTTLLYLLQSSKTSNHSLVWREMYTASAVLYLFGHFFRLCLKAGPARMLNCERVGNLQEWVTFSVAFLSNDGMSNMYDFACHLPISFGWYRLSRILYSSSGVRRFWKN